MRTEKMKQIGFLQKTYTMYVFSMAGCGYHCDPELANNQEGKKSIFIKCLMKI